VKKNRRAPSYDFKTYRSKLLLACVAILALSGCSESNDAAVGDLPSDLAANIVRTEPAKPRNPEKIFDDTCKFCHGHFIAPGMQVVRDIRGRNLPPALVKTFVRNGLGVMPAFRQTEITDEELDALANWIQSSDAPPAPPMPQMPALPGETNEH
jgi:mono/diheme cytochrome c family protein